MTLNLDSDHKVIRYEVEGLARIVDLEERLVK
jgi:hypothetical protein